MIKLAIYSTDSNKLYSTYENAVLFSLTNKFELEIYRFIGKYNYQKATEETSFDAVLTDDMSVKGQNVYCIDDAELVFDKLREEKRS